MAGDQEKQDGSSKGAMPSDEERKQESSKAAQQSLDAQNKAQEYTQAAAGAGDPEERQKLLNQALEQEIAAEKFGKTAKYLQSGTFQGLAAGTGIGVGTGAGLGTLTGALVGGTISVVTGGLGSAVGAGVGALHGPFVKLGDMGGDAVRKVTGDIPGWEATEEQQGTLAKMMGQVEETERPDQNELGAMSKGAVTLSGAGAGAAGAGAAKTGEAVGIGGGGSKGGGDGKEGGEQRTWSEYASSYWPSGSKKEDEGKGEKQQKDEKDQGKSWSESAASYMPSMPSWSSKGKEDNAKGKDHNASGQEDIGQKATGQAGETKPQSKVQTENEPAKQSAKEPAKEAPKPSNGNSTGIQNNENVQSKSSNTDASAPKRGRGEVSRPPSTRRTSARISHSTGAGTAQKPAGGDKKPQETTTSSAQKPRGKPKKLERRAPPATAPGDQRKGTPGASKAQSQSG